MKKSKFFLEYEETVDEMIPDVDSKSIKEIKLSWLYSAYKIFYRKHPDQTEKDQIDCYFERLKMDAEVRKCQDSKYVEKIISRLCCCEI